MQQRLHARVRLRLPVRLRWVAPLGQQSEVCETRNVSRGGLLVACHKHHADGFPIWVTFPFDPAALETQPEVLARVVRSQPLRETDADREGIAVHFEGLQRPTSSGSKLEAIPEAKNGSSRSVALPIRVRPRHILWHEEAMTLEVSADKIRYLSNREYAAGETLLVTFAHEDTKPWQGDRDIPAKIVNVEKLPYGTSLVITLKRISD